MKPWINRLRGLVELMAEPKQVVTLVIYGNRKGFDVPSYKDCPRWGNTDERRSFFTRFEENGDTGDFRCWRIVPEDLSNSYRMFADELGNILANREAKQCLKDSFQIEDRILRESGDATLWTLILFELGYQNGTATRNAWEMGFAATLTPVDSLRGLLSLLAGSPNLSEQQNRELAAYRKRIIEFCNEDSPPFYCSELSNAIARSRIAAQDILHAANVTDKRVTVEPLTDDPLKHDWREYRVNVAAQLCNRSERWINDQAGKLSWLRKSKQSSVRGWYEIDHLHSDAPPLPEK